MFLVQEFTDLFNIIGFDHKGGFTRHRRSDHIRFRQMPPAEDFELCPTNPKKLCDIENWVTKTYRLPDPCVRILIDRRSADWRTNVGPFHSFLSVFQLRLFLQEAGFQDAEITGFGGIDQSSLGGLSIPAAIRCKALSDSRTWASKSRLSSDATISP